MYQLKEVCHIWIFGMNEEMNEKIFMLVSDENGCLQSTSKKANSMENYELLWVECNYLLLTWLERIQFLSYH